MPVPETRTKLVVPDDVQLIDCRTEQPPLAAAYLMLDADGREELLTRNIKRQIDLATICNARWAELRTWKAKQLKTIPAK